MKAMNRILFCGLLMFAVCFFSGCGKKSEIPVASVSGAVTFNGKPVKEGTVWFAPEDKGLLPARGILKSSGKYSLEIAEKDLKGAYVGNYKIWFDCTDSASSQDGERGKSLLPEKYNSPETSALSAVVEEGKSNVFDFDLK